MLRQLLLCLLVAKASSFLILYFHREYSRFQRAFFTLHSLFLPKEAEDLLRGVIGILSMYLRLHP